jgi:hypothetical protein
VSKHYLSISGVALVALVLLVSCDKFYDYETTSKSTITTNTVTVKWFDSDKEVAEACVTEGLHHIANGCAFGTTSHCTIYAVQPSSFDDKHRLEILGHELWHCLGATHK